MRRPAGGFVIQIKGLVLTNEESLREYKARIRRVIDLVEDNIGEKIFPGALAEVSGFSPYHFQEIFHSFVGETPDEFVNRIRLERAASRLITYPSEQIAEAASASGFPSASVFAKAFREHFGCSAREWRSGNLDSLLNGRSRREGTGRDETISPGPERSEVKPVTGQIAEARWAEIRSMPSFRVVYQTDLNGLHRNVGKLFARLRRWADSRGILASETKMIGISLDNPAAIAPDKRRYYACLTVPAELEPEPEIAVTDIRASLSAVLRFEGDAGGIEQAYDWIYGKFIPENGYQPADMPSYEIYDGSFDNRDRKLSVDICVPVEALEA